MEKRAFDLRNAVMLPLSAEDASGVRSALQVDAVTDDEVGPQHAGRSLIVLAERADQAVTRMRELMACGVDPALIRFVAYGERPLADVVQHNRDWLRHAVTRAHDHLWDINRFMDDWPTHDGLSAFGTGLAALDDKIQLTLPEVIVVVGGYGSGKSTFAQMLAMGLAYKHGMRADVTAWEDDREDFRQRLWRFALAGRTEGDAQPALVMERLIRWTEPTAVTERAVEEYFERVRYLAVAHQVKVFVLDPWNELDHDYSGKNETLYVREMMTRAQQMTKELGIIFVVTVHLPKSGYDDTGKVKPFRVAHAAGSAEFANKATHGFCIARTRALAAALNPENITEQRDRDAALAIIAEHGPPKSDEHMIIAVDKTKIEKVHGKRTVFAAVLNQTTNRIEIDAAATLIAQRVWRTF